MLLNQRRLTLKLYSEVHDYVDALLLRRVVYIAYFKIGFSMRNFLLQPCGLYSL